jgi:SP family arabinose:H+ symporter-like MFS transporter
LCTGTRRRDTCFLWVSGEVKVGREEEAAELLREIYKEEYVEDMIREKQAEANAAGVGSLAQNQDSILSGVNDDAVLTPKALKISMIVAVHLAVLQQFCGVNVVVLYGGQIIDKAVNNPSMSKLMQIFLISTQFIACVGTSFILAKLGRKTLLQIGTAISTVVLMVIGIAFLALEDNSKPQQYIVITSLYIFMTSFGFTLGPVVWLYIPEIVPANVVPYTTLANWAGASITVILFPIIGKHLRNGTLFFFFAGWCLLSLVFNHKYVVETRNKTDKEIKRSFNALAS